MIDARKFLDCEIAQKWALQFENIPEAGPRNFADEHQAYVSKLTDAQGKPVRRWTNLERSIVCYVSESSVGSGKGHVYANCDLFVEGEPACFCISSFNADLFGVDQEWSLSDIDTTQIKTHDRIQMMEIVSTSFCVFALQRSAYLEELMSPHSFEIYFEIIEK